MIPTRPIVCDTREQLPWEFEVDTMSRTMKSGDYSLFDEESGHVLEDLIAIERKSLPDFLGSITSGRERFEREIVRLHEGCAWPWLVVESSLSQLASGEYRSNVSPKTIFGTIESWVSKYRVHWVFAGDRLRAQVLAQELLAQADYGLKRKECSKEIASGNSVWTYSQYFESSAGSLRALEMVGCGSMGLARSITTRTPPSR